MNPPSTRAATRPNHASGVHCAVGLRVRTTSGLAPVGIRGTPSIPEVCVPAVFSSGRRPSAFLVRDGRLILIGMQNELAKTRRIVALIRKGARMLRGEPENGELRMKSLVYISLLIAACPLI